ncbi:hypothetical protein [Frondihabitans cladoniiphilus]|uniref:Uncharacterized protein n=1 Tax=Frondihabitans cladoniiphilus TaxID=715785 RepID=A0ABP8VUJ6_9MICO
MGDALRRSRRLVLFGLLGVACALVGMLPPLAHGGRLTLQNLWATPTTSEAQMPIVFLPFSQYQLDLVAGTILIGSALAGIATRIAASRVVHADSRARLATLIGLLVAQLAAFVQTAIAVGRGLGHPAGVVRLVDDSLVYLVAVSVWIVLLIALGAVVFRLLARPGGSGAVVAVALASVTLGPWIVGFVRPVGSFSTPGFGVFVAAWLPGIAVGAAIGAAGLRSWHRIVGAVVALVVLWAGTAALSGIVAAAGSRALLRLPDELAQMVGLVFRSDVTGASLRLAGVAAATGVVALVVRQVVGRRPGRREARP